MVFRSVENVPIEDVKTQLSATIMDESMYDILANRESSDLFALRCNFGLMIGIVEAPDWPSKVALRQLLSGEFKNFTTSFYEFKEPNVLGSGRDVDKLHSVIYTRTQDAQRVVAAVSSNGVVTLVG